MGGLYWASKQPGGIKGTWDRLKDAAKDIRNGADPMSAGRRFVRSEPPQSRVNDPELQSRPDIHGGSD
jgi:hypothetical protein